MSKKGVFKHGASAYERGLCRCGTCRTAHAKYERERRVRRRKKDALKVAEEAAEREAKRSKNRHNKMMPRIKLEMMNDTFTREALLRYREEDYEQQQSGK